MTGPDSPRACCGRWSWQTHAPDCPSKRSPAPAVRAGHKGGRHVADILGHSVYVGDQVVAMVRYRSGSSSYNHALVICEVTAILPKRVRIAGSDPGPWDKGPRTWDLQDHELVKVTDRRP